MKNVTAVIDACFCTDEVERMWRTRSCSSYSFATLWEHPFDWPTSNHRVLPKYVWYAQCSPPADAVEAILDGKLA